MIFETVTEHVRRIDNFSHIFQSEMDASDIVHSPRLMEILMKCY